jgi:flavin reductase (DIM6/NTAB) family NADH-FMN oxidoreductase RutF
MMVDQHSFRAVLGRFSSGVTVVTTSDKRKRDQGMTVSAFCSVSLDPPLVLMCIEHTASIYKAIAKATHFTVNILSDGQEAIARRFAEQGVNRFDSLGYSRGLNGMVVLDDVLGYVECEVTERHEAGDHDIIIGLVEVAVANEGKPLLYYRGGYAQLER